LQVLARKSIPDFVFPNWDPQPGSIDVAVMLEDSSLGFAFELKVDDIGQTLWDIYKMVTVAQLPTVAGAFVTAAARPARWRSAECGILFSGVGAEDELWYSSFLFDEFRKSWAHRSPTSSSSRWWTSGRSTGESMPTGRLRRLMTRSSG
jgi:hypothetical protein